MQLRSVCLLLSAAAACPIFDLRSMRAHYLQPPAPLAFTLSPRALELASLQPWCRDNTQRAQLLCSCCPLSTLAFRLPRAVNRHHGSSSFELNATARITQRCFSVFAWRLWPGSEARILHAYILGISCSTGSTEPKAGTTSVRVHSCTRALPSLFSFSCLTLSPPTNTTPQQARERRQCCIA